MVTHSKFDMVMSSRHLAPHRYKTFSSKLQYQMVLRAVCRLQESGFYWASISGKEAGAMLASQPSGTFLIRDSADQQHFFTLSVKTPSGTKNVRVQCDNYAFFLQTEPEGERAAPRFDCMLKLVTHYMFSKRDATARGNQRSAYYIYSGGEKVPLELLRPLLTTMASLKHLCRKTVNGHLDVSNKSEELPLSLKNYLEEYDASI
ncbi:suppressor of cytokine signaling 3a [Trichomycterus rosablanca]|uniref:suppressor of cytokine signaling 3a n=1 Tax=Trichomycterus rosablanca TaxID=2290929 RepID=UPI002F35C090